MTKGIVMSKLLPAIGVMLLALGCSGCATSREAEPRWYKGNTHTHSFWSSDGDDFPEMIVDWYRSAGYDFLAISDHNVLNVGEKWLDIEHAISRSKATDVLDKYRARFPGDWVETRELDGVAQVRLKTLEEYRVLFEEPQQFLLIQA